MTAPADTLRTLLQQDRLHVMPCCFDPLSAKLIEQAGFDVTFMSGFAVSSARLGLPDTGLISYGEIVDTARNICAAVKMPVIGDGDTGYGNPVNVKRTVQGYAGAGMAAARPGVVAAHTTWPVVGVPIASGALNGVDALYSIVQMPPGVPVAAVGIDNARNAALLAARILALDDDAVADALARYREQWGKP